MMEIKGVCESLHDDKSEEHSSLFHYADVSHTEAEMGGTLSLCTLQQSKTYSVLTYSLNRLLLGILCPLNNIFIGFFRGNIF